MNKKNHDGWDILMNHKPYSLDFDGLTILIEDGVFTPDPSISYSASMILDNLPDVADKTIADVGTGTGVIGLVAASRGAQVVATDISEKAIENATFNSRENGLEGKIDFVKTNLLDGVSENFDYIFANIPIAESVWSKQGVDVDSTVKKFLTDVKEYLNKEGKIYLPWGSFAEQARIQVEKILNEKGLTFKLLTKNILGFTWYLYIISIKD
ncbi:methyltransferase [Candidatus Wolfebacteria bacterium]|nr:methyltransferase [Candidatus Wolfebacteria bacterium]